MRMSILRFAHLMIVGLVMFITNAQAAQAEPLFLLGAYVSAHMDTSVGGTELQEIDAWVVDSSRRLAIAGEFVSLTPPPPPEGWSVPDRLPAILEGAWSHGYVPFVNLTVSISAGAVAQGQIDSQIRMWAATFATWAGTTKKAMLLPLPEMNGYWNAWYDTPENFKAAYPRIRQIFAEEMAARGVPTRSVLWVFGPNIGNFEAYYPGEQLVDAVGLSAYNAGACDVPPAWYPYSTVIEPFLNRAAAMAPGKPLLLSQTGVIASPNDPNPSKDAWLADTYSQLARYPSFRAAVYYNVILFNQPGACSTQDYRVHPPGTTQWAGYKTTVTSPSLNFGYYAPASVQMRDIVFGAPLPRIFLDVTPFHPWAVDDDIRDYAPSIHRIYADGITSGCSANPLLYCPTSAVTRAAMAIFLLRGRHGASYAPPPATGQVFADVSDNYWAAAWIEQFAKEGMTSGCATNPPQFCPDAPTTRAAMSVFMLRAIHGSPYVPPAATGQVFVDVTASYALAAWVEQLYRDGVSTTCPPNSTNRFCPDSAMTRDEMAIFMVRGFNLP